MIKLSVCIQYLLTFHPCYQSFARFILFQKRDSLKEMKNTGFLGMWKLQFTVYTARTVFTNLHSTSLICFITSSSLNLSVMWIRIDCIRPQNLMNPDPDPGRIQVNKICKFSKHLKILKIKKKFNFQVTLNLLF